MPPLNFSPIVTNCKLEFFLILLHLGHMGKKTPQTHVNSAFAIVFIYIRDIKRGNLIMGIEINVTSVASSKNKVFTITKKDASGQVYTMTATIFDKNKKSNLEHEKNVDAPPSKMIIDSNDAVQFKGDFAHFTSSDIASPAVKCALFENYDETEYDAGNTKDVVEPSRQYGNNGVNGFALDTGKNVLKLGDVKEILDKVNPSATCGQGNQAPAAGGSRPAAEGGSAPQFGNMTMPDLRQLESIMSEAGYRAAMLMPDGSATPYVMGADTDAAINRIMGGFAADVKALMGGLYGSAPSYTPPGSGSGSGLDSGSSANSVDDSAAKKAKEAEEAKKAREKAEKEELEKAQKEMKEKVTSILQEIYDAMQGNVTADDKTKGINSADEKLKHAIGQIKTENVVEVLDAWGKSEFADRLGNKSLIGLIGDKKDVWYKNLLPFHKSDTFEYVNPIKDALKDRAKDYAQADKVNQLATIVNDDYNSLRWDDSQPISDVQKLYDLVKKEETEKENSDKIPMMAAIKKAIAQKAEEAKTQAQAQTQAKKAEATAVKAEEEADKAKIDAALAAAIADAGKKGLSEKVKNKVVADAKAMLAAEKAEKARVDAAEKKAAIERKKEQDEQAKSKKTEGKSEVPTATATATTTATNTVTAKTPAPAPASASNASKIADLKKKYIELGESLKGKSVQEANKITSEQAQILTNLSGLGLSDDEIKKLQK